MVYDDEELDPGPNLLEVGGFGQPTGVDRRCFVFFDTFEGNPEHLASRSPQSSLAGFRASIQLTVLHVILNKVTQHIRRPVTLLYQVFI